MDNDKYKIKKIDQLNLEIFGGCNLKCPMCPQGLENGREVSFKKNLKEDLFKKIIDEALPLGLRFVNLTGSGEPFLNKNLTKYVKYLSDNNVYSLIQTNGKLLNLKNFQQLCEAGLDILKISCMGWDKESYKKWMSVDYFNEIREIIKNCLELTKQKKHKTIIQTNHLIQDYEQKDLQLKKYIENWVDYLDVKSEIWLAHNWSGIYQNNKISRKNKFDKRKVRSCGRPLSNVIEIRAGGLGESCGAVVPCPNVLGQDSKAVLGHLSDQNLLEAVNSEKYIELRKNHLNKNFDQVDYCKNCDHIYDVPESLVWTNIDDRTYGTSRVSLIDYLSN
jgi:MoaA/NifB/PqqE/SkfB family radical SAM enzyme